MKNIPQHKPGESKNDWMKRCVPYVKEHEGASQEEAVGKCSGMYDSWKKKNNEESDMKKTRVLMHLTAPMFKPVILKDEPDKFNGFDRATILVGDGKYNDVYFPAEELEKAFMSWEKQPINLDHSDKLEDEVGFIKEVFYDQVNKKITAKPFLNQLTPKTTIAAGYINGRLAAGKIPEVSVGVWLDRIDEDIDGDIRVTARNLEGEHLALVTRGACSPDDGCGIGLQQNNPVTILFENYVNKKGLYNKLEKEILKQQIKLEGGRS